MLQVVFGDQYEHGVQCIGGLCRADIPCFAFFGGQDLGLKYNLEDDITKVAEEAIVVGMVDDSCNDIRRILALQFVQNIAENEDIWFVFCFEK